MVVVTQAAVSVYTVKGDFNTAANSVGTQAFTDNLNSGSLVSSTVTRTDVTISGASIFAFPNTNPVNTADGSGYLRFRVDQSRPLTFTFNSAVIGFGFDTNPRVQGVGDTFTLNVGGTASSFSMPATDTTGFRGFISDTPFTTFTLSDSGSTDDFYGIDNLEAYTAVPEPSAYAATTGVLLAAFALYRKRHLRT